MKFVYANSPQQEADFIIIGVADESGSHSSRSGSKKGADAIRKVAHERCVFKRKGRFSLAQVSSGRIDKKIYDYGNVDKKKISKVVEVFKDKTPIILGGDHSITAEVLKGMKDVTVIYFDAHPDIVSSMHGYYGSVLSDVEVDLGHSIEIGIREPEIEELKNIKKKRLEIVTAEEIYELGLEKVWEKIKRKVKGRVYVSVDLDVFDPSIAPGVSAPVPGGLNFNQVLYLMKRIMKKLDVVGFDIMELNPRYDQDERTAHLAVKLLLEMIVNCEHPNKRKLVVKAEKVKEEIKESKKKDKKKDKDQKTLI
ncbi:arginase family protein [archaeon]|jgi:agmatinase|nr:arginase family protein [archaeon]MBT3731354.1 arginase family protein [archaeon]MBT4670343.1 arginase family protein [archaeon]MBT5029639.1 arginase family protein [archaeon]MBT5287612.1 arginase family protein [archaeon]